MDTATVSVDEFQALEAKVLRAVELIRAERDARAEAESARAGAEEARAVAEQARAHTDTELQAAHEREATAQAEIADLRDRLAVAEAKQAQIDALESERAATRERVGRMLQQMDELL